MTVWLRARDKASSALMRKATIRFIASPGIAVGEALSCTAEPASASASTSSESTIASTEAASTCAKASTTATSTKSAPSTLGLRPLLPLLFVLPEEL